jgi:Glycine rich protein
MSHYTNTMTSLQGFVFKKLLRQVLSKRSLALLVALTMLLISGSVQAQDTYSFTFTGDVQTFVVPAGVELLSVDVRGAQGGGHGGNGGRVETVISVTPSEVLYIYVGGQGGSPSGCCTPGFGGFNGGGNGGVGDNASARGGGGASDIRSGGTTLANRIVVAGGGGGEGTSGGEPTSYGGVGGGLVGGAGETSGNGGGGGGGTQTEGGAGGVGEGSGSGEAGSLGVGGHGGSANYRGGAGGGGGYFGGGGGGGIDLALPGGGGGGGGGSSYSSGTNTIYTSGFQDGDGLIIIKVVAPSLSCVGFESPMNSGPVKVKHNRVLPLKAQLFNATEIPVIETALSAFPLIQVLYNSSTAPAVDVTDQALSDGQGTPANQFEFSGGKWQFNLETKKYTAPGTYTITMVSGNTSEYLINPTCVAKFVIE